ncbi:MAG: acetyl-CoA carboxylase carboxyl transferase subunit alpha [Chlamydiales bacterium]
MTPSGRNNDNTPGLAFERPIRDVESELRELEELSDRTQLDLSPEIEAKRVRLSEVIEETYSGLSAWERVNVARHPNRPVASDYIKHICEDFVELHGDRVFGDDPAIVTGLATIGGRKILLVGHRKGRTVKERLACNFGCAHPEGYRKALRKMQLAERLGLPIVTLINTPGAYPGMAAEERGQAAAIAENILAMFQLKTPILTIVIGEGGSGGALGIGVGDRVLMLQYAYYSVITPEGCAAILWRDGERSPAAAEALRLTAKDLLGFKVIDGVVPEPAGGAHRARDVAYENLTTAITDNLDELCQLPTEELVAQRRKKYRRIGAIEGRFPVLEQAAEAELQSER